MAPQWLVERPTGRLVGSPCSQPARSPPEPTWDVVIAAGAVGAAPAAAEEAGASPLSSAVAASTAAATTSSPREFSMNVRTPAPLPRAGTALKLSLIHISEPTR